MEIHVTKAQFEKLNGGKPIKLSYPQLVHHERANMVGSITGGALTHKAIQSLIMGKPLTIHHKHMVGGSFTSFLKSAANGARRGISFIKEHAGTAAEAIKQHVPQEFIKSSVDAAITAAALSMGQPELALIGTTLANKAISAGYNHDFRKKMDKKALKKALLHEADSYASQYVPEYNDAKALKREYEQAKTDLYREGLNAQSDHYAGITGGALKKGSPAMKERMAQLRARRGKKSGGKLPSGKDILNTLKKVGNTIKQNIRPIITQGVVAGINGITGSPAGTIASPVISVGVNKALEAANLGFGLKRHTGSGDPWQQQRVARLKKQQDDMDRSNLLIRAAKLKLVAPVAGGSFNDNYPVVHYDHVAKQIVVGGSMPRFQPGNEMSGAIAYRRKHGILQKGEHKYHGGSFLPIGSGFSNGPTCC